MKRLYRESKGKVTRWLNNIITFILFAVLIGVVYLVLISLASDEEPNIFGYQFKIVLSGSMEPDIKTGSIIMVKRGGDMSALNKDDVITFREENESLVTHRIVEVVHSGGSVLYRTKGDSNDGPDINPVLPKNIVAEYTGFTVPNVGYVVAFLQSHNGALLIIFSGFLLLLYSIYTIWRTLSNVKIVHKEEYKGDVGRK